MHIKCSFKPRINTFYELAQQSIDVLKLEHLSVACSPFSSLGSRIPATAMAPCNSCSEWANDGTKRFTAKAEKEMSL